MRIVFFTRTEGELADPAMVAAFYFAAADGEDYIWASWRRGTLEELLTTWPARALRNKANAIAAGGYRRSKSCARPGATRNPIGGSQIARKRTSYPMEDQQTVLEQFRHLPPVAPHELVGLWKGRGMPSNHPFDGVLENLGWYGKRFTSDMRADALLFRSGEHRLTAIDPKYIPIHWVLRFHQLGRTRMAANLFSYLQHRLRARGPVASLKTLALDGVESTAMVYDHQPIVDYFRRLDEQRLMGAMTIGGDERIYFFELQRVGEP